MVSKCEKRKGSGVEGQDVLLPVYFYEGFLVCVECPVSTSVKGVVFFFWFFFHLVGHISVVMCASSLPVLKTQQKFIGKLLSLEQMSPLSDFPSIPVLVTPVRVWIFYTFFCKFGQWSLVQIPEL